MAGDSKTVCKLVSCKASDISGGHSLNAPWTSTISVVHTLHGSTIWTPCHVAMCGMSFCSVTCDARDILLADWVCHSLCLMHPCQAEAIVSLLGFQAFWPRTLVRCFPARLEWVVFVDTGECSMWEYIRTYTDIYNRRAACSKVQTACRQSG